MIPTQKKLAVAAIVLVGLTWWFATAPESPIRPEPPRPDRPVLRFFAKVAKVVARFGLTALVFMEPAPSDPDESHLAHAVLGIDGHVQLRNERW
ncbi:hypothetical protein EB118_18300 [bacterium]|nr:hypothetical protein [bacterium]NDC95733.1 hypothetical protein [bacterium]NDD85353.1 hypothetical protein [bacterium]NDG32012.1 hypothetical protein [bacterium]